MPSNTWYDRATVYALDVKRFADADGDGIGDFAGLTDRLSYLSELGVSAVWLLPFYPSPLRDNGYDVADYRDVDDRLGSLEAFDRFVAAAHERDIRVITDLVVNHTSEEHPWFQAAREDPDSKYRDYYVWADDPSSHPTDGGTPHTGANEQDGAATGASEGTGAGAAAGASGRSMFPGEVEDARVWSYDPVADAHYFHRFYPFQPDLNISNPAVRQEIGEILGFWLDRGVDGFRIDAATLMIQPKGIDAAAPEDPFDALGDLKHHALSDGSDAVLLAEADDAPERLGNYVNDGGMDSLLNFTLGAAIFESLATADADPLRAALTSLPELAAGRWGNFLRNHDELNLATLPEKRRQTVYDAFAPEQGMRIYERGIRRRLAPMLGGDRDRIELTNCLLFSLPGTPVVYYGDEVGMGEDLSLPGREAVRTPMQWDDGPNAGFSSADPADLFAPVVSEGPFAADQVNVADQRGAPDSMLEWMRDLIATRGEIPAFDDARCRVVEADDAAFVLRYDGPRGALVCALNVGPDPVAVDVETNQSPTAVVFGEPRVDATEEDVRIDLDGYGYGWLRVGDESAE